MTIAQARNLRVEHWADNEIRSVHYVGRSCRSIDDRPDAESKIRALLDCESAQDGEHLIGKISTVRKLEGTDTAFVA